MSVIALGTFDGVHKGHKQLIEKTVALGRERNEEALVYTFRNHPRAIYAKEPALLMSSEDRIRELESYGCRVVADEFNAELSRLSAREFAEMLCSRFDMHVAVGGFNYTFGYKGSGDMEQLAGLGKELGFVVEEIPALLVNGEPASSTRVRKAIQEGDIRLANALLAKPWTLSGIVREGKHNGHRFGFPTANLDYDPVLVMPEHGVYTTIVRVTGKEYLAATNVGTNPTVGGQKVTIEPHILDFSGNLYGQRIEVCFLERQRGEVCFDSEEALSRQIGMDVAQARKNLEIWEKQGLQA